MLDTNLFGISQKFCLSDSYSELERYWDNFDKEEKILYSSDLEQIRDYKLRKDHFYFIFADIEHDSFKTKNGIIFNKSNYLQYFEECYKTKLFKFDSKKYAHELIKIFFEKIIVNSVFIFIKGAYFFDKFNSFNEKNISIANLIKINNKDLNYLNVIVGFDKDWRSDKTFIEKKNILEKEFLDKFNLLENNFKLYNNDEFKDRVIVTDKYYIKVMHFIDFVEILLRDNKVSSNQYDDISIQPLLNEESLNSYYKILDNSKNI